MTSHKLIFNNFKEDRQKLSTKELKLTHWKC